MHHPRLILVALGVCFLGALICYFCFPNGVIIFMTAAGALTFHSVFIGVATEQISTYLGENLAGLLNVSLGNLAELIIVYTAVKLGLHELVQANIIGSIVSNLLLVLGMSIYFGCRVHGSMPLNRHIVQMFLGMLFVVGLAVVALGMADGKIGDGGEQKISDVMAIVLFASYLLFLVVLFKDKRFDHVQTQAGHIARVWSLKFSIFVLVANATGVCVMADLMLKEVSTFGTALGLSTAFMGRVLVPFMGNVPERAVAVRAAMKNMPDLSISIAVGSAAQVGMVLIPAAVLFGHLTGNPFVLHFDLMSVGTLGAAGAGTAYALRDNELNLNEAIVLVAAFAILSVVAFYSL